MVLEFKLYDGKNYEDTHEIQYVHIPRIGEEVDRDVFNIKSTYSKGVVTGIRYRKDKIVVILQVFY